MRTSTIKRKTNETDITLNINLDGKGESQIKSGNGFFDHMLTLFSAHSRIDMNLFCDGDTNVDFHHSAEDIGIALGNALSEALGDKRGIYRYSDIHLPMDEALILCALDISGRSTLVYNVTLPALKVANKCGDSSVYCGDFDTELVEEFLLALVRNSDITLHVNMLYGTNTHHIIEGIFKALGRVIRRAVAIDINCAGEIPSTKGTL